MSEPGKAVFLSYASQDAEAAQRICEALRAAGVEVWFDQNELVGGDVWDQKIRKQIKECALFVPIVSANTQARLEGYFRLEWKLAEDRSHLMAKGKPFLLPVVIDDTNDREAQVPDAFLSVQWTRLRDGETPASFCDRVRALLDAQITRGPFVRGAVTPDRELEAPAQVTPAEKTWSNPARLAAVVVVVAAMAAAVWQPWRRAQSSVLPAAASPPPVSKTAEEVAKLRARLIPDQWKKEDFEPWSATLDKLIAADDQNADAWALRSFINSLQVMRTFEASTKPLEAGRAAAQRALLLAPTSPLAELALGMHHAGMISRGGDPQTARAHLSRALASLPSDPLTRYADLTTAWFSYDFEQVERSARAWLDHEPKADYPAYMLALMNLALRNATEASAWSKRAGSDQGITGIRALCVALETEYYVRADLTAVRATLEQMPPGARTANRVLHARWLLAMAERSWDSALQELARTPETVFFEGSFYGPKAVLAGLAHAAAGRTEVALTQFREADRTLRELLAGDSQNEPLHALLALVLAHTGRASDARNELALVEPAVRGRSRTSFSGRVALLLAQTHAALGDDRAATGWLRELLSGPAITPFTPASFRIDPRFQNIIAKPEVQALLAEFAHLDAPKSPATTTTAPTTAAPDPMFIAVLPFETTGGETDTGLADGMHDEVLAAIAKVAALKVVGRTSVLPYRDAAKRNLKQIAADLGVGSVVSGLVRRAGNRVRISVELVDTQSSRQLWSGSYEHEVTDVFAIQTAVAEKVATTLRAAFTASERAALERRPTDNPRAYELYLQAKVLYNDLNSTAPLKDWERVAQVLGQAVALDPGFARAHALLAYTHATIFWHGSLDPSATRRELARQSLAAAQRLAPTAAETRIAEGRFAYTSNTDFAATMRHYQAALLDLPNDSALLHEIGLTHRQLGQHAEAAAAMSRAHELNPLDVSNAGDLLSSLVMLRRFADAAKIGARYTGRSPELRTIINGTIYARYELDADREKLASSLRTAPAWGPDILGLIPLYVAALRSGDLGEAARVLADPRLVTLPDLQNSLLEPVALHRAMVARLIGRREDAAAHALEAESYIRARSWTTRQQPMADLVLVRAAAYAGKDAEALQRAAALRQALGTKRGLDAVYILNEVARVYAILGARNEAFACLQILMTGPNAPHYGSPRLIRIDPCWSRLADDPRFEEILSAAKPL